jgi:hypothetical protein
VPHSLAKPTPHIRLGGMMWLVLHAPVERLSDDGFGVRQGSDQAKYGDTSDAEIASHGSDAQEP